MAKKNKIPDAPADIPAWFMTYSDVITLLMTFFILLLTFATTEPERFEKVQTATFSQGGATGIVGQKIDGIEKDSWVNRIRPRAARIAMRGAEMPPLTKSPALAAYGEGLKSLEDKDKKHSEMTSHHFDIELSALFNSDGELSNQGNHVLRKLGIQLKDLPIHASFQFADDDHLDQAAKMLARLYRHENIRAGQVGAGFVQDPTMPPGKVRVVIERFLRNQP